MSTLSSFKKRNPKFTWFMIIAVLGLAVLETANIVFNLFPDKGAGFVGAGIFAIILFFAMLVEDKLDI